MIEEYLNYPFSWDSGNTTFDDQMYKNMVTLLAVYQVAEADSEVRAEISERFTSEEIQTFNSIKSVINGNISSMNKIYSDAAKTYQACIKALEKKADEIIDNGKKANSALDDVLKCWRKVASKKEAYNKAKEINMPVYVGTILSTDNFYYDDPEKILKLMKQILKN